MDRKACPIIDLLWKGINREVAYESIYKSLLVVQKPIIKALNNKDQPCRVLAKIKIFLAGLLIPKTFEIGSTDTRRSYFRI